MYRGHWARQMWQWGYALDEIAAPLGCTVAEVSALLGVFYKRSIDAWQERQSVTEPAPAKGFKTVWTVKLPHLYAFRRRVTGSGRNPRRVVIEAHYWEPRGRKWRPVRNEYRLEWIRGVAP